jgi:hypothetical protein
MTDPTDPLVEKLCAKRLHYFEACAGSLINPNGPEAADEIERLQSQVGILAAEIREVEDELREALAALKYQLHDHSIAPVKSYVAFKARIQSLLTKLEQDAK